jgi:hypothetical protein
MSLGATTEYDRSSQPSHLCRTIHQTPRSRTHDATVCNTPSWRPPEGGPRGLCSAAKPIYQSGRSLPGFEWLSAHEPRRRTSPRRTHQTARTLSRSPLPLQSPSAFTTARGDQRTANGEAPLATTRSPSSLDHGLLACLAGILAEADDSGRRAGTRQAVPLHTPNTGCHSLSAAETASRPKQPPRTSTREGGVERALSGRNRKEQMPAPGTSPRVTSQQSPAP